MFSARDRQTGFTRAAPVRTNRRTWAQSCPNSGPPPVQGAAWGPAGAVVGLVALLLGLRALGPAVWLAIDQLAVDIGRVLLSGPPRSILGNLP